MVNLDTRAMTSLRAGEHMQLFVACLCTHQTGTLKLGSQASQSTLNIRCLAHKAEIIFCLIEPNSSSHTLTVSVPHAHQGRGPPSCQLFVAS